jgi:hypothetical protein
VQAGYARNGEDECSGCADRFIIEIRMSFSVKLDPNTTVASLLVAIPSSRVVFEKLGIRSVSDNENKTLVQLCADCGITFEEFLLRIDEIDWHKEPNNSSLSRRSEE